MASAMYAARTTTTGLTGEASGRPRAEARFSTTGIHAIDLMQWVGGLPTSVMGIVSTRGHDIESRTSPPPP